MTMRVLDRLLVALLCLVGIAACVLLVGEVALILLERGPWLLSQDAVEAVASTPWSDQVVVTSAVVTALVGLLLLVVELRRRRAGTVAMTSGSENVLVSVTRRSLEQSLRSTAAAQPGVSGADVRVRGRRALVTARTGQREAGDTRETIQRALAERMTELRLAEPLTSTVAIDTKGR